MKEEGPVTHRSPETGVMAATQGHTGKHPGRSRGESMGESLYRDFCGKQWARQD